INWKAPYGSLVAVNKAGNCQIVTPDGLRRLRLISKRRIEIKNRKLIRVFDEISHDASKPDSEQKDDFLFWSLYSRGDPRLQDIVKTIQSEQDEIIRYPANTTLVINGVAGSGKSSIALHRVSVLLYPGNSKEPPKSTIVFCPNRVFLEYIKDLLPSLGDHQVEQMTFNDWALNFAGLKGYKYVDSAIDVFISPTTEDRVKSLRWRRAKLKNTRQMISLLDNHIEQKKLDYEIPDSGWVFQNIGPLNIDFYFSKKEINEVIQKVIDDHLPFDQFKKALFIGVNKTSDTKYDKAIWERIQEIESQARQKSVEGESEIEEKLVNQARLFQNRAFYIKSNKPNTLNALNVEVAKKIDALWPKINVWEEYYQFIGSIDQLKNSSKDMFKRGDVELLLTDKPQIKTVEAEDIPAIFYFRQLIDPVIINKYDHVVVDEGQDFSEIQYEIIRSVAKSDSITITGDIFQGINAHRGINSWDELNSVFPKNKNLVFKNINTCYRSTKEITEFANAIIKTMDNHPTKLPVPFNRKGEKPRIIKVTTEIDVINNVISEVKELKERKKIENIAVITKNRVECINIFEHLIKNGI
ncbi:MAG: hypothetical protein EHM20_14220, partial [Alphaproteobacteria bacterium]